MTSCGAGVDQGGVLLDGYVDNGDLEKLGDVENDANNGHWD